MCKLGHKWMKKTCTISMNILLVLLHYEWDRIISLIHLHLMLFVIFKTSLWVLTSPLIDNLYLCPDWLPYHGLILVHGGFQWMTDICWRKYWDWLRCEINNVTVPVWQFCGMALTLHFQAPNVEFAAVPVLSTGAVWVRWGELQTELDKVLRAWH